MSHIGFLMAGGHHHIHMYPLRARKGNGYNDFYIFDSLPFKLRSPGLPYFEFMVLIPIENE